MIVTVGLSLFSKLRIITAPEVGRGATAGDNPEECQGQKVTCTTNFLLITPYPDGDVGKMIKGYRLRRRVMVELVTYLLTWSLSYRDMRRTRLYKENEGSNKGTHF